VSTVAGVMVLMLVGGTRLPQLRTPVTGMDWSMHRRQER